MNPSAILYQMGLFIGILLISVLPYLAKKQNGELPWDHYYTVNMLYSYIIAVVATFIIYKENPFDPSITDPALIMGEGLIIGIAATPTVKYLRKLFAGED